MRQHFQKEQTPVVGLSLEEEAIALSEMAENQTEAVTIVDDVDRVQDIDQGMDDVQTIMGDTETPTDAEKALMDAVAEMAVSGTDMDPDDIAPSDAIPDGEVSTEGLVETVKAGWAKLMELIKAGWKHIVEFFGKMHAAVGGFKVRIKQVRERAKSLSKLKSDKPEPMEVADPYNLLNHSDKGRDLDHATVVRNIDESINFITKSNREIPRATLHVGLELIKALNEFDPKKAQDWELKAADEIRKSVIELITTTCGRFSSGSEMLGCSHIVFGSWLIYVNGNKEFDKLSGAELSAALAKLRFAVSGGELLTKVTERNKDTKVIIKQPYRLDEITKGLDHMEKLVDDILSAQKGDLSKLMNEGVDEIAKAGDHASGKLNAEDNEARQALNRIMRVSNTYASFIQKPVAAIGSRATTFLHKNLDVHEKMLAYYE